MSGNALYGTAGSGGLSGNGTVFSLSFTPKLTAMRSGADVVLMWPRNYAGFGYTNYTLQWGTNFIVPAWNTVATPPSDVDGQNVVTNSISDSQMFFRLVQ